MPCFFSASVGSVLLSTLPKGVSIRDPFLPVSTWLLLASRHTPKPMTAPPSTMTAIMMATTSRMTFSAPPPDAGAVGEGAVAAAGLAAAATNPPSATGDGPAVPAIAAPHLVQNFADPSNVAPQDVQNAISHLDQIHRPDKLLSSEYIPTPLPPRKELRAWLSGHRTPFSSGASQNQGDSHAGCLDNYFWDSGCSFRNTGLHRRGPRLGAAGQVSVPCYCDRFWHGTDCRPTGGQEHLLTALEDRRKVER